MQKSSAQQTSSLFPLRSSTKSQVYRSFKLPPNVDTGKCEAKLEDGVLKVKLTKRQALSERTVEIK